MQATVTSTGGKERTGRGRDGKVLKVFFGKDSKSSMNSESYCEEFVEGFTMSKSLFGRHC